MLDLARAHGVEMPITEQVVRVCHEGDGPGADRRAKPLMSRDGQARVSGRARERTERGWGDGTRWSAPATARAGSRRAVPARRRCSPRRTTSATRRRAGPAPTATAAPSNPTRAAAGGGRRRAGRRRLPVLRHRAGRDHRGRAGLLRPGDTVVLPSDGYYTTRPARRRRAGAASASGDSSRPDRAVAVPGGSTASGWCCWRPRPTRSSTSATSPRWPRAAHAAGALVAVDNTTATPLGQRPLDLGADLVVASDTKALTGHSDLLLGYVSATDDRAARAGHGLAQPPAARPGAFDAWLAHRSLGTLDLRLARQAANAAALAELLAASPGGDRRALAGAARRPVLRGGRAPDAPDPRGALGRSRRRPTGWPVPRGQPAGGRGDLLRRPAHHASTGGPSGATTRAPGFVRLSCGIEDTADLVADLSAALDALR